MVGSMRTLLRVTCIFIQYMAVSIVAPVWVSSPHFSDLLKCWQLYIAIALFVASGVISEAIGKID